MVSGEATVVTESHRPVSCLNASVSIVEEAKEYVASNIVVVDV